MSEVDIFSTSNTATLAPSAQKRVAELERIIPILVRLHGEGVPTIHPDTGNIVADIEFDSMWDELTRIKPTSSALQSGSAASFDPNAKKVKHDPPMVSIKKINGKEEDKKELLEKWIQDTANLLGLDPNRPEEWLVQSFKRDGVACALYYEDGRLVRAGSRPRDGVNGEDITVNASYVAGIPQKLPLPLTCSIRGELECRISVFEKLNGTDAVGGQDFANPRNYTSGSIRQFKEPTKTRARQLSFTAYSIVAFDDSRKYYKTERDRAKWCNQELGVPYVRVEKFDPSVLRKMEDIIDDLDYEVDGVVLSVNNLELQDQAGRHGDNPTGVPRGVRAWKFADDIAEPRIKSIEWEVGRTGKITPVLTFKPVQLAGTMVGRAGGYSLGYIMRNNVTVGTQVRIRKSGKIIPESLGFFDSDGVFVDKDDREGGSDKLPKDFDFDTIDYPKKCPSCGDDTEIAQGQKHGLFELVCENADCPARNVRHFVHYLQKFGVKGIAESVTDQLVEAGMVRRFADFYELTVSKLQQLLGTQRTALLTVARIHMVDTPEAVKDNKTLAQMTIDAMNRKKRIPLSKFIACLGLTSVGKTAGAELASHFRDFDKIVDATESDFLSCNGIGDKAASTLAKYFEEHGKEIRQLVDAHIELELPKTGKFTGRTFVFTGGQPEGKDYWKDKVENEGGKVSSSVGKKTDFVIIGADPGQKADKAHELKDDGQDLKIIESHGELVKLFA